MASTPAYPSVVTREIDLSTRINNGDITSFGAIAINSSWGPAEEVNLVVSENDLVALFGKPNSDTYIDFFVAANFLSYSSALQVVRVIDSEAKNAASGATAPQVKNLHEYENGTFSNSGEWIAKYAGSKGNSLLVAACDSLVTLSANVVFSSNSFGTWTDYFNTIPGTSTHANSKGGLYDEVHILVLDEDGEITGVKGTVLEKYSYLSKAIDAKKEDGTNNYYKDVINQTSQYLWIGDDFILGANSSATVSSTFTPSGNTSVSLSGGVNVNPANTAMYVNGYDLFSDKKDVDVSHLIGGKSSNTTIKTLITIAENRGDCIAFVSPAFTDVQPGQTQAAISGKVVEWKNSGIAYSSSYYFADGNWKYQYDKYNDINRWIPCNGDTAGLKARAELTNDVWWNGSGYNRGLIRNCIRLAWNPKEIYMGEIYKNGVNPIIAEGGSFILLGDKTGQVKPSSFDRINVRSLFNLLKRKIADYLKYGLFDFNDEFTRAQLTSHVEVYLQSIKSRRGIEDFVIVCDLTNNDGFVRDNNTLNMDVYVKPTKSINWIVLSMVNVGSSVSFNEVVGKAF